MGRYCGKACQSGNLCGMLVGLEDVSRDWETRNRSADGCLEISCPSGLAGVAGSEGFSGTSPEDVKKLRGCVVTRLCSGAEGPTGARLRGCAEDWGYIRPAADGESAFVVRPVTGSHLFRPTRGRALGLSQPPLPCRHLSGTSLGDI